MVARGGMCGCLGGHAWLLPGGHAWLLWGACMVALGDGACLLRGGMHGCSRGGHAWLLRGECVVALGGMVASRGVCMGYDEIQRYSQ